MFTVAVVGGLIPEAIKIRDGPFFFLEGGGGGGGMKKFPLQTFF